MNGKVLMLAIIFFGGFHVFYVFNRVQNFANIMNRLCAIQLGECHIGYAKNKILHKSTGHHFNLPGHSWQNMKFSVVDKLKSSDKIYRQEKEKHFIKQFNSYYDGLNMMP